jgi:hypothetical protein
MNFLIDKFGRTYRGFNNIAPSFDNKNEATETELKEEGDETRQRNKRAKVSIDLQVISKQQCQNPNKNCSRECFICCHCLHFMNNIFYTLHINNIKKYIFSYVKEQAPFFYYCSHTIVTFSFSLSFGCNLDSFPFPFSLVSLFLDISRSILN